MGPQVENMNRGGWVGDSFGFFNRGEKRGKLPLNEQTLGHRAPLIAMVTCMLVVALAAGKEDE